MHKIPISAKGIVFEGDSVWLRKNERNEWELPGGKIEEGEQPEETVKRELMEELGFKANPIKIIHAWVYRIEESQDESLGVLVLSYLCKLEEKSGVFETEGEWGVAEFNKFSLEDIENLNIPEFYKKAIRLGWEEYLLMK